MLALFAEGVSEDTTDDVELLTGHTPRHLRDYLSDHPDLWRTTT
ncbi:hypothetical protein ACFFX0_26310 [Citricoccus parietis]